MWHPQHALEEQRVKLPAFRWDRLLVFTFRMHTVPIWLDVIVLSSCAHIAWIFLQHLLKSASTALHLPQVFREADIQALKEAMQLTRLEAIQALKHTVGDVSKAFINELSAFDLRVDIVDDLVRNYAAQRQAALPCPCTQLT